MKQVTLYWDNGIFGLFYHNGKKWRYKPHEMNWRDCINQNWSPDDFDKSLTVNNFKEKGTLYILETVKKKDMK